MSNLRVAVLSDAAPALLLGGGSRLLGNLLGAAPDDYDIELVTPDTADAPAVLGFDRIVTVNATKFSDEIYAAARLHPFLVNWEGRKPSPLSGTGHSIFESPLQHALFKDVYRVEIDHRSYTYLPRPLDLAALEAAQTTEHAGAMWCGQWLLDDGGDIAVRWAHDRAQPVDFYGGGITQPPVSHCAFMPMVSEPLWYQTMARYDQMLYFPRIPDYGYAVLEGYALGLNVEVAGRLGIESWDMTIDELVKQSGYSATTFWHLIGDMQ